MTYAMSMDVLVEVERSRRDSDAVGDPLPAATRRQKLAGTFLLAGHSQLATARGNYLQHLPPTVDWTLTDSVILPPSYQVNWCCRFLFLLALLTQQSTASVHTFLVVQRHRWQKRRCRRVHGPTWSGRGWSFHLSTAIQRETSWAVEGGVCHRRCWTAPLADHAPPPLRVPLELQQPVAPLSTAAAATVSFSCLSIYLSRSLSLPRSLSVYPRRQQFNTRARHGTLHAKVAADARAPILTTTMSTLL